MDCPYCNKEMKETTWIKEQTVRFGKRIEVLGRCEDCDYDGIWMRDVYYSKRLGLSFPSFIKEYDLKKYFFG